MILRLLVYVALIYLGYRAIKSWTGQSTTRLNKRSEESAPQIDDIMVKDPMCNVYFPKKEGIHLRHGGKDLYFCSKKCKDEYLNTHE